MEPVRGEKCPRCGGSTTQRNPEFLLQTGYVLSFGRHRYTIGASLGQGGFGVTYTALDMGSERKVAIKEYFPTRCAKREPDGSITPKPGQEQIYSGGRHSFLMEAEMLASLEGMPSVVQGLVYFETNNTAYLVMEFIEGTPLYRIVQKDGRIPAERLLPRMRSLMEDMAGLHDMGVIHRDVSPDNIMWTDAGLKLLDFGSAKSVEDGKSMEVVLKHGFAPVEQYQTHGQGSWTDVYALGASIYYCLTGVIPPQATERLLDDTLQPPARLGAALTPEEEAALLKAMAVRPGSRYQDMRQFANGMFPELSERPSVPGPQSFQVQPVFRTAAHFIPWRKKKSFWQRFRDWMKG